MAVKICTIDPDGDLLLLLTFPVEETQEATKSQVLEPTAASDDAFFSSFKEITVRDEAPEQVHILVSSKHLRLASRVFYALLQPNFKEGQVLQATGKLELPLPDDDPVVLEILLNIIHGRTKDIPRKMDIYALASLATLADKYEMAEAMELFVELLWRPSLQESRPKSYDDDFVSWLTVAWIFKWPDEFKHFTRLAVREGSGALNKAILPVPERILNAIGEQRQHGIAEILSVLQAQIDDLIGPSHVCKTQDFRIFPQFSKYRNLGDQSNASNCDAMMLGSLLKCAGAFKLYPFPAWPYESVTLKDLVSQVLRLQIVSLCDATNLREHNDEMAHGVMSIMSQRVLIISQNLNGFDLDEFK